MAVSTNSWRRTPLHAAHVEWGAKFVAFGGWEMPVQYSSIREEHLAVRERIGLFDVSHMGELIVSGFRAEAFLNRVLTNDVRRSQAGRAQYTFLCNERGGILDDLVLYWLEPMRFLLLVNAANTYRDFGWLTEQAAGTVRVENHSDEIATLALQGPLAPKLLPMAAGLGLFHIGAFDVAGFRCWIARTGYTGEDGFELFCASEDAPQLWDALLTCGAEFGIRPCGLGARDTLRMEMCYPLHGQDITAETTPLEAGLGRFIALDKGEFIGRSALVEQKEKGVSRKLVPFKMLPGLPPPRPHYPIIAGGQRVGEVTSGAPSPSLGVGIGLGYVATGTTQLEIEIRGKRFPATIEKKPLYKKPQ